MSTTSAKLTFAERIELLARLLIVAPATAVINIARGLPVAIRRGISVRYFITCAIFRVVLGSLPARQTQALLPSSDTTYRKWLSGKRALVSPDLQLRLREDIEPLDTKPESSILWLGDRKRATKFVLFFHGGGYIVPLSPGHLEWCWQSYVAGGPGAKQEVAVALLQYTLAPGAQYPSHLRQAGAALSKLLSSGISPSDIIVGGDSAGGNLTVQLLRHLVDPCSHVIAVHTKEPFAGSFIVSPVVDGKVDAVSFHENEPVDMISASLALDMPQYVLGKNHTSNPVFRARLFPLEGDMDWASKLSSVTRAVYITGGKQEVFRDQICAFYEALRRRALGVVTRLEMMDHEAHDFILVEGAAQKVGDATRRMRRWATECL